MILSLLIQLFVDGLPLPAAIALMVRLGAPIAAVLMPLGFFLSVLSPKAQKPNAFIGLVYLGGVFLSISVIVLGLLLVLSA